MKTYFKNFAKAMPLAIGLVLTVISARLAMSDTSDAAFGALITGLIGIPLAVASLMAFSNKENA